MEKDRPAARQKQVLPQRSTLADSQEEENEEIDEETYSCLNSGVYEVQPDENSSSPQSVEEQAHVSVAKAEEV